MMRSTMAQKIVCTVVAALFLVNDICFGLSTMPGSTQPGTKDEMYALGGKLFAAKRGPGAIDFDDIAHQLRIFEDKSDSREESILYTKYRTKFVPASDVTYPKGWEKNPILTRRGDLISALKEFRDKQTLIPAEKLDIIEGYFPVDEVNGELPIAQIVPMSGNRYVLVVHTKFVQMWNHIRANDVWFELDLKPGVRRTVSVAWGIFYRLAKHEMAELSSRDGSLKTLGHVTRDIYGPGSWTTVHDDEGLANEIGGNYAMLNDAIWMWFLGSYCFSDTTRYNNKTFLERARWFFAGKEARELKLNMEFPNLLKHGDERLIAQTFAHAINYKFFNRPGIKIPEMFSINPKFTDAYYQREAERKAAGIIGEPVYATGSMGKTDDDKVRQELKNLKEQGVPEISLAEFAKRTGLSAETVSKLIPKVNQKLFPYDRVKILPNNNISIPIPKKSEAGEAPAADIQPLNDTKTSGSEQAGIAEAELPANKSPEPVKDAPVITKTPASAVDAIDKREAQKRAIQKADPSKLARSILGSAKPTETLKFVEHVLGANQRDKFLAVCREIRELSAKTHVEDSNFVKAIDEALTQDKAVSNVKGEDRKEPPVASVHRSTAKLTDLADHAIVNALIRAMLDYARSEKGLRDADRGVYYEQRSSIFWLGRKFSKNNKNFADLFDKLVDVYAGTHKMTSIGGAQLAVARDLVKEAGMGENIEVDDSYVKRLRSQLSLQVEHFGVESGQAFIMKAYHNQRYEHTLIKHIKTERLLHHEIIKHLFNGSGGFDNYRMWRKGVIQYVQMDEYVYRRFREIDAQFTPRTMTYREFVQWAHEMAEEAYPVAGLIPRTSAQIRSQLRNIVSVSKSRLIPEPPTAAVAGSSGSNQDSFTVIPDGKEATAMDIILGVFSGKRPLAELESLTSYDSDILQKAQARFLELLRDEQVEEGLPNAAEKTQHILDALDRKIASLTKPQEKHPLIQIISEYIVNLGPDKGPGAEKLSATELENTYKTIALLKESQIELFVPQRLRLTENMKKALKDIGKRDGREIVIYREYSDEEHLLGLLEQEPQRGAKRMVLAEDGARVGIGELVNKNPEIFRNLRLLSVVLPSGYSKMESVEKTAYQAKFMTIAMLGRLFEKDKTPMVEALLRDMLESCFSANEESVSILMNELGVSDEDVTKLDQSAVILRILRLLGTPIKLVEKIGQEIRLMKNFWTAA